VSERMRRWMGRRLWQLSVRAYEDFHNITILGPDGKTVASVGCYGQYVASWQKPYDIVCSCE
jgi:hypothetical protein